MNKKYLLLIFTVVFILAFYSNNVHAQTVGNCTNYANYSSNAFPNKTWIIANTSICMQVNIDNLTNITIKNGGSLFLQLVNVSFVGNTSDTLGIAVENGGTLKIDNGSRIFSANGSALGFSFYYYGGSSGFINNSSISALQNFTGSNGSNGIMINTTNFFMSNTTINNSYGYALNISAGSPTIQNSTFFNNPGGILVWNASPTITNITIRTNAEGITNETGLNITNSNNGSYTNISIFNMTFGVVLINANLSFNNITIDNSTYGIFPKNGSKAVFFDTFITNTRSVGGGERFPNSSAIYFNYSSNGSNITLVTPTWTNTNYTFYGNNTANLSEVWYIDFNVTSRSNNTYVQGATIVVNGSANLSTISRSFTTNSSGTISRINLTSFIVYYNGTLDTNVTANYSNYWFNASKGNSSSFNISTNITNNFIFPTSGFNLTLNLSTITINTKGSGAAAGYTAQNALISLKNGSFNFTGNTSEAAGVVTIDVPFGVYTINTSSGNYSQLRNTTYTVNVSEGSNTSYALNVTLLPNINLTANYSGSFWSDSDQNVTTATAVTIAGRATYAYNGASVNGTFYLSSATSYLHDATTYRNTTLGGAFTASVTPSETSSVNDTVTLWLNDSHGDNGTKLDWLWVHVAPSANASGSGGGLGGGGGGGGTGDYSLLITSYDGKLTISQGETKTVSVSVKNTGLKALKGVGMTLSSINSDWYVVNVSTTGLKTKDIASGDTVIYNIKFTIPLSATPGSYSGTWRAKDKDALAIAEKTLNLTVTQTWSNTTVKTLNESLTSLEKLFTDLEKNITDVKDSIANYSSTIEVSLNDTKEILKKARAAYDSGNYDEAKKQGDLAASEISKILAAVEAARGQDTAAAIAAALTKPAGIALLGGIVVVASLGGFFLWWQFFRIIPLSTIRKNPARFSTGARVEGVIKSITDTQKGKVFLVHDTSGEKLHIRYPYYTTADIGDIIRVSGVIKVYKDIPYMDATELARVSLKPRGGS